jgi:hypothetical protein
MRELATFSASSKRIRSLPHRSVEGGGDGSDDVVVHEVLVGSSDDGVIGGYVLKPVFKSTDGEELG